MYTKEEGEEDSFNESLRIQRRGYFCTFEGCVCFAVAGRLARAVKEKERERGSERERERGRERGREKIIERAAVTSFAND